MKLTIAMPLAAGALADALSATAYAGVTIQLGTAPPLAATVGMVTVDGDRAIVVLDVHLDAEGRA